MFRRIAFTAGLTMCATGITLAQSNQPATTAETKVLTIGDKAPDFDIAHWIKGKPVEKFEDGKVYVMEFWATWCGPCKAAMPHLSELQKEYADYGVTMISVSDEPLPTVVNFLCQTDPKAEKLWFEKIDYTLTTDPDMSVKKDYFTAAGQRGIPSAFIIGKDQHIEWIGHPMQMDEPLQKIVHDDWDRAAFKAKWDKDQAVQREAMAIQQKLQDAMLQQDWDTCIALIDGVLEKDPKNFNLQMTKFNMLLTQMNKPKEAYAFGNEMVKTVWDNGQMLNAVAWNVVANPAIKDRDLDFAMKVAKRANELTKSEDAGILDTLARVYYEKGDLKNAIKYQEMAVEHAGDTDIGDEIKATLERYQSEMKKGG